MKHANISVFVPHIGCNKRCSFCNQNSITGQHFVPTADFVRQAVNTALGSDGYNPDFGEIAFFGGSFTAIDKDYRQSLLSAAYEEVLKGNAKGIRVSTRPDAIDEDIIDELLRYGVTAVELGAQSMCDDVLEINRRGHTAKQVETASRLIKSAKIELGLQMMTGLLGDTPQKSLYTAKRIIAQEPKTVRVYPTITLKNTYLEKMYRAGKYTPPTLEESVSLCADIVYKFHLAKIDVIRLGLHSIEPDSFAAGPWHPAFGELTEGEIYYKLLKKSLANLPLGNYTVFVGKSEISKAVGQKKRNITRLAKLGYNIKIKSKEGTDKYCFKTELEE